MPQIVEPKRREPCPGDRRPEVTSPSLGPGGRFVSSHGSRCSTSTFSCRAPLGSSLVRESHPSSVDLPASPQCPPKIDLSGVRYFWEVRLEAFLEVDFRVLPRVAGLRVRPDVFRAEDACLRVPVLFEVLRARALVFFEPVLPPGRLVLEPDRAVDFRRVPSPPPGFLEVARRRASAPTPAAPAAPTAPAAARRGRFLTAPAAPLATRAAPPTTLFALLCFFFLNISVASSIPSAVSIYPRGCRSNHVRCQAPDRSHRGGAA
jgi:hypothetical protein